MNIETLIDTKEAAAILGITVSALHRLCARGSLPSVWKGGIRLFAKRTVVELELSPGYRVRSRRHQAERLAMGIAVQRVLAGFVTEVELDCGDGQEGV